MGVVVRRYIDILIILLIPTALVLRYHMACIFRGAKFREKRKLP